MIDSVSYRNIWKVSLPIVFSGVAENIINVTDTAFLGRLGTIELGAAGNAGIFYFVLMVIGIGFTMGCQIIMGRRNGEGNLQQIGPLFSNALGVLLPLSLLVFLFIMFSAPLMDLFTSSDEILKASNSFLKVRGFGVFFAYLNFLFIAFYTGITKTRILTYSMLIQSGVNVLLDYLLIFGHAGFPMMGIEGAALASVIAEASALLFFVGYANTKIDRNAYKLRFMPRYELSKMKKIFHIGLPVMFQNFFAVFAWLAFFLIIEKMGEKELAASHIVRSIYMVLMIPLFGFSSATNTLVSNVMGQGRIDSVSLLVKRIVYISLMCTGIMVPFILFLPNQIIGIYTSSSELISISLPLLKIIAGSMFLFSIAYILFSAVTGTGKTQVSLWIELICIAIYLFSAYLIGIHFQKSLTLVWCSEFIYFSVMSFVSLLYLKYGNWKTSKV